MSLQFTEGSVPEKTVSRVKEENPFTGMFPTKGHGTEDQKSIVVVLPSETDEEKKYVNKIVNQAQTAARDAVTDDAPKGYSARVLREAVTVGKGKAAKESTQLTIWSVNRIERPGAGRKPASDSASA